MSAEELWSSQLFNWLSVMLVLVSADCESYCKPVKGNLKINMKKYCKKDYGKTASGVSARVVHMMH